MTLANVVGKIKCFFGFHDWKDTHIRRMYGFVKIFECARVGCETVIEVTDDNISFENIGGSECMRIRR